MLAEDSVVTTSSGDPGGGGASPRTFRLRV